MPHIDLYSDTRTRPTPAMRRAIAEAEVGDEQAGLDPTVNALNERVAALLGTEAAVFLPSGTMCNEIAIAIHCRPGDEVISHRFSHVLSYEGGGPSHLAGASTWGIDGANGMFTAAELEAAIRPPNRYLPRSRLVVVEQTSNTGGGRVWPLAEIEAIAAVTRRHGLALHMDGARLMNAVVASGIPAATWAAPFDSSWIDFSKGLGAPIGACLAGSAAFIHEAWRLKQRWGGAMRQAGIVAAAALYALDHHVDRLAEDHANAKRLAERLADVDGIEIDPTGVDTNLVYFHVRKPGWDAARLTEAAAADGVVFGSFGPSRCRMVTHLDVTTQDCDTAAAVVSRLLGA